MTNPQKSTISPDEQSSQYQTVVDALRLIRPASTSENDLKEKALAHMKKLAADYEKCNRREGLGYFTSLSGLINTFMNGETNDHKKD
jgi:hypothetical protein